MVDETASLICWKGGMIAFHLFAWLKADFWPTDAIPFQIIPSTTTTKKGGRIKERIERKEGRKEERKKEGRKESEKKAKRKDKKGRKRGI
jgi:hypothetical protein